MTKIRNTNGKMRVIIQSPYDAQTREQRLEYINYARRICRDSSNRGENPFASHLYYPQFLDSGKPEERADGINFGYEWWPLCHKVIFYIDLGMSHGMLLAMQKAVQENKHLEMRRILGGQALVDVPPIPEEQGTQMQDEGEDEIDRLPAVSIAPPPAPTPPPPPVPGYSREPDEIARALDRALNGGHERNSNGNGERERERYPQHIPAQTRGPSVD